MNVKAQKFQSQNGPVCKSLASINHRTTLPQSALAGCQLPQRGSRERHRLAGCHSPDRPETMTWRAIFIAPTKLRMFNRSQPSDDTPSGREPGCHQSNVSRVVVYSWQVTPDLSPVMGRGLADRAFSRRSAAWGRQMWRRSMASAFRMLWGLA